MAADEDDGVNLSGVMSFDSTRAALMELPTVMPRLPPIPLGQELENATEGNPDDAVLNIMAQSLRSVTHRKGFGLAVEEGAPAGAGEGAVYAALARQYPDLIVGRNGTAQIASMGAADEIPHDATGSATRRNSGPSRSMRLSLASITPSDVSNRVQALEELQKEEQAGGAKSLQAFDDFLTDICLQVDQLADSADQDSAICELLSSRNIDNIRDGVKFHNAVGSLPNIDLRLLQNTTSFLDTRARLCTRELESLSAQFKFISLTHAQVSHTAVGLDAAITAMHIINSNGLSRGIVQEEIIENALALLSVVCTSLLPSYHSHTDKPRGPSDITAEKQEKNPQHAQTRHIHGLVRRTSTLVECLATLFKRERGMSDSLVMNLSAAIFDGLKLPNVLSLHMSCALALRHLYQSYPSHRRAFVGDCKELISYFPPSRRSLRGYRLRDTTGSMRISSILLLILAQSCTVSNAKGIAGADLDRATAFQSFKEEFKLVRDFCLEMLDSLIRRCFGDRDPEFKQALHTFIEDIILGARSAEWPAAADVLKMSIIVIVRRLREALGTEQEKGQVQGITVLLELLGWLLSTCREILKLGSDRKEPIEVVLRSMARYAAGAEGSSGDQLQLDSRGYWISSLALRSSSLVDLEFETMEDFDAREVPPKHYSARLLSEDGSLSTLCDSGVEIISLLLHSPYPTIRARCVKSLTGVATISPLYLRQNKTLRDAIEHSCMDVSILVREASLDLLSRTFGGSDAAIVDVDFLSQVYPLVEKRLLDTATSVRKRSVLILQNLITNLAESRTDASRDLLCEACAKVATRLDDHEKSVRDVAVKTLRQVLLGLPVDLDRAPSVGLLCRRLVGTASRMNTLRSAEYISQLVTAEKPDDVHNICRRITSIFPALISEAQDLQTACHTSDSSPPDGLSHPLRLRRGAMIVIESFVRVSPLVAADHCDYLALELKCGYTRDEQSDLLTLQSVLAIVEKVIPTLPNPSRQLLESVERDTEEIIRRHQDPRVGQAAVRALCTVSRTISNNYRIPKALAEQFLNFIASKTNNVEMLGSAPRSSTMALVRSGLFCRYGLFDTNHIARTYKILTDFYRACDSSPSRAALALRDPCLRGISHVFITHRDYLAPSTHILKSCLQSKLDSDIHLLFRVLSDLQDILQEEEDRNSTRKGLEKTELSAEEDSDAGFLAGTAQGVFGDVECLAAHSSPKIRALTCQLVAMLVRQGLVLPALAVPCMVLLSVDPVNPRTRESAQRVLSLIADRHPQMLYSNMKNGVSRSPSLARATKSSHPLEEATDDFGFSRLSPTIMLLARKKRQMLIESIIRLYDPKSWKDDQTLPLFDQVYLASSIASLDYLVGVISVDGRQKAIREEILPIVSAINKISSTAGQQVLQECKLLTKEVSPEALADVEKRAVSVSILLCLKHHLKFVRFRTSSQPISKDCLPDVGEEPAGLPETRVIIALDLFALDTSSGFGDKRVAQKRLEHFRARMKKDSIEESEVAFLSPSRKRKRPPYRKSRGDESQDEGEDPPKNTANVDPPSHRRISAI